MIRCEDWRACEAARVRPLLDAEGARWLARLGWDVTPAWRPVEPARAAGALPGFVAVDRHDRIAGWTCFLVHEGVVQTAMFVAESADTARLLIDATLASPQSASAGRHLIFTCTDAPALDRLVRERGFVTERYRYLSRSVSTTEAASAAIRPWQDSDAERLPALAARAYRGSTELRPFVFDDTDAAWRSYCRQLLTTEGCGRFLPSASFAIDGRLPSHLAAAIVTTRLSPMTAHIAQVVVAPASRQRGLGRTLVERVLSAAGSAGCADVTLLVAETNAAANELYARLGFVERASFLCARRG